jgi:hypothetical protein
MTMVAFGGGGHGPRGGGLMIALGAIAWAVLILNGCDFS